MGTEVETCLNLWLAAPSPAHASLVLAEAILPASDVVPCRALVVIKQSPITLPHMPTLSAARTKSAGWRPSVTNHTICHLADGGTAGEGQIQLQHVCQIASPCWWIPRLYSGWRARNVRTHPASYKQPYTRVSQFTIHLLIHKDTVRSASCPS